MVSTWAKPRAVRYLWNRVFVVEIESWKKIKIRLYQVDIEAG